MKTFKLAYVEISDGVVFTPYHLLDGLIINQEDEKQRWLIELFLNLDDFKVFENYLNQSTRLQINVKISRIDNNPAQLEGTIITLLELGNQISVLIDCKMKTQKTG